MMSAEEAASVVDRTATDIEESLGLRLLPWQRVILRYVLECQERTR